MYVHLNIKHATYIDLLKLFIRSTIEGRVLVSLCTYPVYVVQDRELKLL